MSEPVVLVIGGGLTGLHAAVAACEGGARAIVLERGPVVGGKRAAWLAGEGDLDPRLADVGNNDAIEILTLAELQSLAGEAGHFTATIEQRARFVSSDCTRCNHCVPVCPQAVPNEFDVGLTFRKAIHSPMQEATPGAYVVDIDTCLNVPPNYLPCQRCVDVCDDNAIHFDMPLQETLEREVAAVIVATGFACDSAAEKALLAEFGYGAAADVLSSVELQRLLEDPGPSGGFAVRPSDEAYPERVLLVLTRLSAEAAWVMSNHLRRLADQDVEELTVLILAQPGEMPELDGLMDAIALSGASLCWGTWNGVEESDDGMLVTRYTELPSGRSCECPTQLLVLSSEVHADSATAEFAQRLGLALDERGYLSPSRPGIYIAGGALGTVGIEAGREQAAEAVKEALLQLEDSDDSPSPQPDWTGLPPENQRDYLEHILHRLFELGRRG